MHSHTHLKAPELQDFCQLLANSYHKFTNTELAPTLSENLTLTLYQADEILVAHRMSEDPIFCFANLQAQKLWEMDWAEFTQTPSRKSAPEYARAERQTLLDAASQKNIITDYSGVRISKSGKLFRINNVTLWNIFDHNNMHIGQAARFHPAQIEWDQKESAIPSD